MEELDRLFNEVKEESQRTFGSTPRDLCIAHHALRRGHLRLCYRIINQMLPEYFRADADRVTGLLTQIHAALQPTVAPMAAA